MPMRSEKQRRFLWANHPALAKAFELETPAGAKLPKYAATPKKKKKLSSRFTTGLRGY